MRLELAERLRCPVAHAPTPLIVVAQRTVERELVTAMLGCPVCRLEARIVEGEVRFAAGRDAAVDAAAAGHGASGASGEAAPRTPELERVVALLGLAEPGGSVLLTGRYAALEQPLAALVDVGVVVMHAGAASTVHGSATAAPFTDATFRGVALDAGLPAAFITDAVRATAVGGRVLADASVAVPMGLDELARDDTEWVAARESGGAIVELKRRV